MKTNKIIIIITIILLIVAAVLYMGKSSSTFKDKDKNFAVKDTALITKIFLADKKNQTVLLERQNAGEWLLNETFLARQSGVEILLETVKNLVPKYPVPKKAHDNIVSQMAASSIKVEIYQMGHRIDWFGKIKLFPIEKLATTYYVGSATADNMGTFMLIEGADAPFVVHLLGFRGYVAPRYSTVEKEWRDHTVFKTKLYDIHEIVMEIPREPESSYKVTNREEGIQLRSLQSGELMPYDTLKMLNFLTSFTDVRYEELYERMDAKKQDSTIHSLPRNIITLIDKNSKEVKVKTFYKSNIAGTFDPMGNLYPYDIDRLFAVINEEQEFVLIQYFVFDKVLRPLSYFMP